MEETIPQKTALAASPLHPLLAERWSPRAFSAEKIEPETLYRIFEAARWSASSVNEQPWRFILGLKGEGAAYEKIFSALSERNQRWAHLAPVLAIGVAKKSFSHNGNPNRFHPYDTGQAVAYLTIQALAEGVFIHQIGGYSAALARDLFNIPAEFDPMAALAMGYLGDPALLPVDLQASHTTPRQRRPLAETVFGETWGETMSLFER